LSTLPAEKLGLEGVAFGLALGYFAAYQLFKLPVVLPVLLDEYGYDRALAGGFMSVYALAGLIVSVSVGRVLSARGPTLLVALALALVVVGSLVTLAAPHSGAVVLAGRGLEGIAFAILAIVGPVLANAGATRTQLPIVIGLTAAWIPIGQLCAALLAPLAIALASWRDLWHLGLAGALLLAMWLTRIERRQSAHRSGAAPPARAPGLDRRARADMLLTGSIFMLWSGQYFAFMTWLPQFIVEGYALDVSGALAGYVVPVTLVMTFNVATGIALRSGWSLGKLMAGALVSQTIVWWCIPLAVSRPAGLLALCAYGIGAGIVPACLFAMPSAVLGEKSGTARAFAILMTGRNLGVLVGPILVAQGFKLSGDWSLASPVFGGLTALCTALGILLARRIAERS
jgi:MFS family permease